MVGFTDSQCAQLLKKQFFCWHSILLERRILKKVPVFTDISSATGLGTGTCKTSETSPISSSFII